MLYISSVKNGLYYVTDTSDGTTQPITKEDVEKLRRHGIELASGRNDAPVNAMQSVVKTYFDFVGTKVKEYLNTADLGETELIARAMGKWMSMRKECEDNITARRAFLEPYMYDDSIKEVLKDASKYTNSVHELNISTPGSIAGALKSGVCLILQQKTKKLQLPDGNGGKTPVRANGALTAFVCTANISIMDKIYEPYFFDKMYLTKNLYSLTHPTGPLKAKPADKVKPLGFFQAFSCSLRFRGKYGDETSTDMEISSPFYTVNSENVLLGFSLDNPYSLGSSMLNDFYQNKDNGFVNYEFSPELYDEVCKCVADGVNYFEDRDKFSEWVDMSNAEGKVVVDDLVERFADAWGYLQYLRQNGGTISNK